MYPAEDQSPVEGRRDIPGFWYDPITDNYFREEPGFHPSPPRRPPPTPPPPPRPNFHSRRPRNTLGVLQLLSQNRLCPDERLRFVLRTVSVKPDLTVPWTTLRRPQQVLVRSDGCNLVIINHQPMLDSVQFVGQRLEWKKRTSPRLTSLIEFHRCADGLTAQWAGPKTIDGDPVITVRNPKFGTGGSASINFLLVDVHKWSAFEWFSVTTQDLNERFEKQIFRSNHVVCTAWSSRYQELIVGGDRGVVMYDSQYQRITTEIGHESACSLTALDRYLFAGRKGKVDFYDLRAQVCLKSPQDTIDFDSESVIKQMAVIKDGRYLLAEDAVGTIHQCDSRRFDQPIASMPNRTPDCFQFVPFQLDETEDILTSTILGHGAHIWDLRTSSLLRCIPVKEKLLTAAFKRQWDSVLLFCREDIKVAPLC